MPNSVLPTEFKQLIPRFQSSMCGKFIPTITNFIQRFYDYYSYEYNEDGSFTDEFKADLCALGCTEVGLCPVLKTAPIIVAGNATVSLTFEVTGPVPYDYDLFRAIGYNQKAVTVDAGTNKIALATHGLDDGRKVKFTATTMPGGLTANQTYYVVSSAAGDFKVSTSSGGSEIDITSNGTDVKLTAVAPTTDSLWDSAIQSDTDIDDTTLVLTDATVTNDTVYYYRLVVSKSGCANSEYVTNSVLPTACYVTGDDYLFTLTQGESALTVNLTAAGTTPIPDGTTVKIYRSTNPAAIGTLANSGAFAGGTYTYTDGSLQIGTRYYYTVKVQQTGACTEYEIRKDGYATSSNQLDAPILSLNAGILSWAAQDGIGDYWVYANSTCGGGSELVVPGSGTHLMNAVNPLHATKDNATNRYSVNLNTLKWNCCYGQNWYGAANPWVNAGPLLTGSQAETCQNMLGAKPQKSYQIVVVGSGPPLSGVVTHEARTVFQIVRG
jgi:hypothetical protein